MSAAGFDMPQLLAAMGNGGGQPYDQAAGGEPAAPPAPPDPLETLQECLNALPSVIAVLPDPQDTQDAIQALHMLAKIQTRLMSRAQQPQR